MYITDLYLSLILGVTVALIFVEITGVSPGGIIVPGYLALQAQEPLTLIIIFMVALSTFGIVKFVLPKYVILYGRRKFVAVIVIAMILKLILEFTFPILPFEIFEIAGIGILMPALLANGFMKQGIKLTMLSAIVTVFVTFILFQAAIMLL